MITVSVSLYDKRSSSIEICITVHVNHLEYVSGWSIDAFLLFSKTFSTINMLNKQRPVRFSEFVNDNICCNNC